MGSVRLINEDGYKALRNLAKTNPSLFTTPMPEQLISQVIVESGTDAVWGAELEFQADLSSLNAETGSGPSSDAVHAMTMREALSDITPATTADGLLWASINCFALPNYVPIRWGTSNNKDAKQTNFVEDHWLQYSGSAGRKWNAAARLWWMGELSQRISHYSQHTADELLGTMAGNVNFYHQTIDRAYIAANPRLLAVIYDVFLDGNEHLSSTKAANDMLKSLNMRAGASALDMMDYDDLRVVVEEAKPPKGH